MKFDDSIHVLNKCESIEHEKYTTTATTDANNSNGNSYSYNSNQPSIKKEYNYELILDLDLDSDIYKTKPYSTLHSIHTLTHMHATHSFIHSI